MFSRLQFLSGYPIRLKGIGKRPITFNDRINVLFGPNGSGKSTVLKALAAAAGCEEGGWSVPRDSDARGADDPEADVPGAEGLAFGMSVDWDRKPVFFQDCYRDSDVSFIDAGYLESRSYLRSTGEKRIGLVNELITYIENRFLTYKLKRSDRPTLLLDEVDNHIGLAGQSILWRDVFSRLSKKYQLIISTHSIFPVLLRRENSLRTDNIIVLAPRYDEICLHELRRAILYFNNDGAGDEAT